VGGRARRVTRVLLRYAPPLAWKDLLAFLAARAARGVEEVAGGVYRRTARLGNADGWLEVRHDARRGALAVALSPGLAPARRDVARRVRALFDLDRDLAQVEAALGRDRRLAPLVARRPGLRVPGAFDGFEVAVRAVLGQQVSVRAATTLAGRLALRFGEPLAPSAPPLDRFSPAPQRLAAAGEEEIARIGLPAARARTLAALARAAVAGALPLERGGDPEVAVAALRAVPGVGPWTASYVAMRALGAADAFPAGDLGLRTALGVPSARDVERRAERWRPWRAYAALHLWAELAAGKAR
jgi:AraC family transcriptional regulator, regulatory protein of adaptative response / DNA-3-methyladenine glycosylase II